LYSIEDLTLEAQEGLDRFWFIQRIRFFNRTDETIATRLYIRDDLFIQAFKGQLTQSLYLALIDGNRRIFGIDYESGEWHVHPYESPHKHEPYPEGLEARPLMKFLSIIETLLIEQDLL